MKVRDLIASALRIINVPGLGALLSSEDLASGLDVLKFIVDTESVSEAFIPGINRHFFPLVNGQAIYTYGPGGNFDTNDFFDPAPVGVELAYIREGGVITDNRRVTNGDFQSATGWTISPAGWVIANQVARVSPGNTGARLSQSLSLTAGTTYRVTVSTQHRAGSVRLQVIQDGSTNLVDQLISSTLSGKVYTFTYTGATAEIAFIAEDTLADFDVQSVQVLGENQDNVSLATGSLFATGSDYIVQVIDQRRYARRFAKGTGGRPFELLFSRSFPLAQILFDNAPIGGDILIMDVLVNKARVTDLDDDLQLHPDQLKWLRFQLAYEIAGEYGKALNGQQIQMKEEAWQKMAAGNTRVRNLEIDPGLRGRSTTFDINRGDP